ncbi:MAG: DinB family protein, partial [Wenzhouxiangella sp.]|nr:DinB family protein [Wenzhouxiangella sp.]
MQSLNVCSDIEYPVSSRFNHVDLSAIDRDDLLDGYRSVRDRTERMTAGLSVEDQNLQSMPEASPIKWHRAHTTWFFETFILANDAHGYTPFDRAYAYLFNSYYNGIGRQYPRARRSLISRPDNQTIGRYREAVDEAMTLLLERLDEASLHKLAPMLVLGLNHEQQHQELIVTDL